MSVGSMVVECIVLVNHCVSFLDLAGKHDKLDQLLKFIFTVNSVKTFKYK